MSDFDPKRISAQRTSVSCEQPKSGLCKEVGGSGRIAPEGVARVSSRAAQFDITDEVIEFLWIELV
jgi:galactose-1-phosphate uridylyltransferase